jgi:uncharacterized protein (DUF924 family)
MKNSQADIIDFWFVETPPSQWFQKNPDFDQTIRDRYLKLYEWAKEGLCDGWMRDVDGCLALCILLDQFPRNMFRGLAQSFATDSKALFVAETAIKKGYDQILIPSKRRFLYLPFEHSESLNHQERSLALFETMKEDDPISYDYALRHLKIIQQFGRFPHRNIILGRESNAAELEFLKTPNSSF